MDCTVCGNRSQVLQCASCIQALQAVHLDRFRRARKERDVRQTKVNHYLSSCSNTSRLRPMHEQVKALEVDQLRQRLASLQAEVKMGQEKLQEEKDRLRARRDRIIRAHQDVPSYVDEGREGALRRMAHLIRKAASRHHTLHTYRRRLLLCLLPIYDLTWESCPDPRKSSSSTDSKGAHPLDSLPAHHHQPLHPMTREVTILGYPLDCSSGWSAYPREEFNLAIAATARLAGSMAKYLGLPLPFRMGHGIGDPCPLRLEGKESNPFLHGLTMLCINVASLAHWMGLEEIREDMALRPLSILSLGIHHYLTSRTPPPPPHFPLSLPYDSMLTRIRLARFTRKTQASLKRDPAVMITADGRGMTMIPDEEDVEADAEEEDEDGAWDMSRSMVL
ncbi:MAG: UV radiation resistance protein and autophagy-related subunit 14-domain-containing protein [Piptocephalis tieghemiana]|nr:MAG: UV radiation resistance protein and autophagy-related subunit 14-domain-containing protein [Piptocephalis tieghemiana]